MSLYFTYLLAATIALLGALPAGAVTGCSCGGQAYSSSSSIGSYPAGTAFVSVERSLSPQPLIIVERPLWRLYLFRSGAHQQGQQWIVRLPLFSFASSGPRADQSAAWSTTFSPQQPLQTLPTVSEGTSIPYIQISRVPEFGVIIPALRPLGKNA